MTGYCKIPRQLQIMYSNKVSTTAFKNTAKKINGSDGNRYHRLLTNSFQG